MRKNNWKLLLVAMVLFIGTSCKTEEVNINKEDDKNENTEVPQLPQNPETPTIPQTPEVPESPEIPTTLNDHDVLITVTFNSTPTYASSSYTNLKYNKEAVLNIEWDDNSTGALEGLAIFNGGMTSDGTQYPGVNFTDGCGNKIAYKAALAINGYNANYQNKEWGDNYPDKVSYTQMKNLIDNGWDIENHSLKHLSVASLDLAKADLTEMNQLLYTKIGYQMNTLVVPTDFAYFMKAAADLGFIAGTTQADDAKDGIALYPTNAWKNDVDLQTIGNGFIGLNRDFNDDWSNTTALKQTIEDALNTSSNVVNKLVRLGSHNATNIAGFANYANFVQQKAQDRLWVTSMRELFEYRLTKNQTHKTEKLTGNKLVILLDQSGLKNTIRWGDLSMKINSDAAIASITVNGADNSSYNLKTGLINTFKQHK